MGIDFIPKDVIRDNYNDIRHIVQFMVRDCKNNNYKSHTMHHVGTNALTKCPFSSHNLFFVYARGSFYGKGSQKY